MERHEVVNRLWDIKTEMESLLKEVEDLLEDYAGSDSSLYERARLYWIGHIKGALSKNYGILGGSMFDFESTIDEIYRAEAEVEDYIGPATR